MMEPATDGEAPKSRATTAKQGGGSSSRFGQVDTWWTALSRLVSAQLCCSMLMQLSYVAFPAYNFALALWCLACCSRTWVAKHPRLLPLHSVGIGFSILTDVIWMSLWVSGRVFYDQFCGQNGVSIVSCGGATDYYPGCQTNRFALFTLIVNDLAKAASLLAMYRIHVLSGRDPHSHHHHHASPPHNNPRASSDAHPMAPSATSPRNPRAEV